MKILYGHDDGIYDMLLMTNGLLVTAGSDESIKIWKCDHWDDLEKVDCIKTIVNAH